MLYVDSHTAGYIYDVNYKILINSACRNSQKYPFIRIDEAGCRSRGGAKLLFKVSLEQIGVAIKDAKIDPNAKIYLPDSQGGYEIVKFESLKTKLMGADDKSKSYEAGLTPKALPKASPKKQAQALIKEKIVRAWERAKSQGQDIGSFCLLLESGALLMAKAGKTKTSAKAGKGTMLATKANQSQEPLAKTGKESSSSKASKNNSGRGVTTIASEIFSGLDIALVNELLAKGLKPSRLYDWARRFKNGGLDALIDVRSSNKICEIDRLGLKELFITQMQAQRGRII